MKAVRRRDTKAEVAIRSILHRQGFRYWVDRKILKGLQRRADLVFSTERIVVFVDGCFWHGCPVHATWPKQNAEFWRNKIETNRRRDADTDRRLADEGWTVIRVWEHEEPVSAAERIAAAIRLARSTRGRPAGPSGCPG